MQQVCYFCLVVVFILIFSAAMLASICWKTAANFGLLFCIRLLLALSMLSASLSISSSSAVNMVLSFDVRDCTMIIMHI